MYEHTVCPKRPQATPVTLQVDLAEIPPNSAFWLLSFED